MSAILGICMYVALLALAVFQLIAAEAGLSRWLGLPGWLSITVGVLLVGLLGPVGGFAVAILGFFGATQVWHWTWWEAALLCFPSVAIGVVLMLTNGLAGVGSLILNRQKNHE